MLDAHIGPNLGVERRILAFEIERLAWNGEQLCIKIARQGKRRAAGDDLARHDAGGEDWRAAMPLFTIKLEARFDRRPFRPISGRKSGRTLDGRSGPD